MERAEMGVRGSEGAPDVGQEATAHAGRQILRYLVRQPRQKAEGRPPVLIILHGYGADEHDLLPIADELDGRLLTISFRAPITLDQGGFAWYHLGWTNTGLKPDDESRIESETELLKAIPAAIEAEGGDAESVILMGFSQGSAMCYSLLGRHEIAQHAVGVRGLVAMSGYIPRDVVPQLREKKFEAFPVLITHGEFDELIPAIALDEAESVFRDAGGVVQSHLYEMGHGVLPETVQDVARWIEKLVHSMITG